MPIAVPRLLSILDDLMNIKRVKRPLGICLFSVVILAAVAVPLWSFVQGWLPGLLVMAGLLAVIWALFDRVWKEPPPIKPPPSHEKLAQLKTWIVPLYNFRFHHEPYRRESDRVNFIGREDLTAEFLALLNNSQNSSGSYLVTGYRGVGKTSLVKKVLHDYADGRHHLNLREKYDLFGPFFMRVWHRFVCWRGRRQLKLHKRMARKTNDWRRQDRPAPSFICAWNWRTYHLYPGIILRALLLVATVSILFAFEPESKNGAIASTILVFIAIALFVSHQFSKHRYAIFSPANWWRWLVRPVVVIHVNLGHERLDPKKILFALVHLLRGKYREPFRILAPANLVRAVIFLCFSLLLSVALYDLSRNANDRLEGILQGLVFEDYIVARKDIPKLIDPCREKSKLDPRCAKTSRVHIAHDVPETARQDDVIVTVSPLDKDKLNASEHSLLEWVVKLRPWQANEIARRLGKDMGRARKLCEHRDPGGYTPTQSLYCSLDAWIVEAYCHNYPGSQSAQDSSGARKPWDVCKDIVSPSALRDPPSQPEVWIHWAVKQGSEWVDRLVGHILPGSRPQAHEERTKVDAPRPYQIAFFLVILFLIRGVLGFFGRAQVLHMLAFARERIVATDNVEVGGGGGAWPLIGRRRRQYDPLDVRQTEALILDILEINRRIPRFLPHPDIVFVFDELDKINPIKEEMMEEADTHRGRSLNEAVRRRKVEVEELLSNLKNLITVAPCRFIFIAGREMMDANLADQTAASHLYSSLFDKVIYVPSFLTDTSDGDEEDISSMVEQYVCRRLLPYAIAYHLYHDLMPHRESTVLQRFDNYRFWSLEVYSYYLEAITDNEEIRESKQGVDRLPLRDQELMTVLQDFVYYLTYRSGGNPKKIALQFERFVAPLSDGFLTDRMHTRSPAGPLLPTTNFMLKIPLSGQYEVQLISQIFLLFHGESSALIRQYGDKLAVATFSILDYLLKFHSSGFNSRDLERMPDVLDINRAPALPQLIQLLLERLLAPYLRRVDNGIYEYRFLLHFQREVVYISQFSEQELAAFNFTLDESISIKQHFRDFRDKQIELRRKLAPVLWPVSVNGGESGARRGSALAVPFVDNILGDLHSLDREYDQALTEYRNVLDGLEPGVAILEAPDKEHLSSDGDSSVILPYGLKPRPKPVYHNAAMSQIILYLRTLLKSGLIFEQRNEFVHASAVYQQAKRMVEEMMDRFPRESIFSNNVNQLSLVAQPYICLAFLYAKRDAHTRRAVEFLDVADDVLCDRNFAATHEISKEENRRRNHFLRIRLCLRRAELLLFRSDFEHAAYWFAAGAKALTQWIRGETDGGPKAISDDPDGLVLPMQLLGYALSGFGDACSGMDLRNALSVRGKDKEREYWSEGKGRYLSKSLEELDGILDLRATHRGHGAGDVLYGVCLFLEQAPDLFDRPIGKSTIDEQVLKGFLEYYRGKPLNAYAHSTAIYRTGGKPAKASLSLWKSAYFLAFGLSYWPHEYNQEDQRRRTFVNHVSKKAGKIFDSSWNNAAFSKKSAGKPSLLHDFGMEAFRWAYRAHRVRLGRIGVTNPKILKWISPPLSQSMIVLGAFWDAHWGKDSTALDEGQVAIRDMGAFPVYPRILAAFLKGRWNFQLAFPKVPELPPWLVDDVSRGSDVYDIQCHARACNAFRFLVDAAEDAEAYEGGLELINPSLGFIYYHLWLTVHAIHESNSEELPPIMEDLKRSEEFRGERERFFGEEFLRTKAKTHLRELWARHGNDEGFFAYAQKHQYLADSFSDSYANGLWAVEYGLLPVASKMLQCLCCPERPLKKRTRRQENPSGAIELTKNE